MAQINEYLNDLMQTMVKEGASDLHIAEGRFPSIRVSSYLVPLVKKELVTKTIIQSFLSDLLSPTEKEIFIKTKEIDFSYQFSPDIRFRGNGFFTQGAIGLVLRLIPKQVKSLRELNLPSVLETFTQKKQGFFLVVGPVGQGKTTTLATMVEMINQTRTEHIITIEDPIEFVFEPKKSIIDQREVRVDTEDFHSALRGVFRQDVNVVMIGEMREPETISTAVTAAETGHLVFSTLHTNNAAQTIDRIIDSFPATQQNQIRYQIAGSLIGILSQRLVPRISGGLIPAVELLITNNAVQNLIREKRTHEINTVIETSSDQGMVDMNRSLADLVRAGEITAENAYAYSFNPQLLEKLL
ncbi:MAG: PilT/PilU family type 4a pilus ATPase [Candidatus Paceibacterota bacterium]|jgi:twitching motility protein PilT